MNKEDNISIQEEDVEIISPGTASSAILQLAQNPGALRDLFQLNDQQASNVQALLTGSGAALAVKLFSKHLGVELSGAIGGLLGGHISRRIMQ